MTDKDPILYQAVSTVQAADDRHSGLSPVKTETYSFTVLHPSKLPVFKTVKIINGHCFNYQV